MTKHQNKGQRINSMSLEEIGNITMRKFVKVKIRNTSVKMQLDTGSDITIIKFMVEHVTTAPNYSRSNRQAECFVDTFKRALRKSIKEVTDVVALQQFLRVYHVIPNLNAPAGRSTMALMFARKVKSVFDKLLPGKKTKIAREDIAKLFKVGEKVYMKAYKNGKQSWEEGIITKCISKMI
ncbi:uncharacterized protein K02A2.6-like [Octopus sinensis]|uniref:Uncharacterized protein K02A2.6-like n=1 Tax=Octopus sinensis TaxID=2607531 RepID=A0A6P7SN07_9MOLL|nr:uncharacterized protein K02A2.6-like [Octopus sinensis]